ncbi:hypothetical protein ACFL1G_02165 [Planctomycetota bacterium]
MLKPKQSKKLALAGILLLLTIAAMPAKSTAANDPLLEAIPAETLFCVRVNNFQNTLGQMDQFLMGASPMPMGASMLVRMSLAGALGDPALKNVDMNGSFAIFGTSVNNSSSALLIALTIPVTNYKQFIEDNPNCEGPDSNKITKITSADMTGQTKTMLTAQLGNLAVVTSEDNYDKLLTLIKTIANNETKTLASALEAQEAELAVGEPVWAYGNIEQASKVFGPVVTEKLQELKTALENMPSEQLGPSPDPEAIINMYRQLIEILMNEIKFTGVSINPQPDVLGISLRVASVPGTDMASMFASSGSSGNENRLLGYLQDGAVANFGFKVNKPLMKKANEIGMGMLTTMVGDKISAEEDAKIKALTINSVDALGPYLVFSWKVPSGTGTIPFKFVYAVDVADKDKFNKAMEEGMAFWNDSDIADFYKTMGLETSYAIKRNIDNYKGVSIDSAKFIMKPIDVNSPQAQMIQAMYGEGFVYRSAIVEDLFLCVVGDDVDAGIRQLIDTAQSGGPKEPGSEMKAALALLPDAEKADFVGTLNYIRLMKTFMSFVPIPMPQMNIPTKSNIALAGRIGSNKVTLDIAVPKEHLQEITAMAQMMMQQQMEPYELPEESD